eukprot:Rhum_TRINITY_DN11282_c0_g1::Rhum_TRINITY_DN11282_c0_g1_i1::g.43241::m.43241
MRTLAFAFGACIALASGNMVSTPGGYKIHKDCIEQVAPGVIPDTKDMKACRHSSPSQRQPPPQWPPVPAYPIQVSAGGGQALTQISATWNVPSQPMRNRGEAIQFWNGLADTAQLPPGQGPVLRPVLTNTDLTWKIQAHFVWGEKGIAKTGPVVNASVGDTVVSDVRYDAAAEVWVCSAANGRTGEKSVLRIKDTQALFATFKSAALVLETTEIVEWCVLLPSSESVTFTDVRVNDKAVSKWANVSTASDCDFKVTPFANSSVKMSWNNYPKHG